MGLFLIAGIITTGIAIYAPATALSAVTAMNLDIAILSTGIVCMFYTSIGGMKAVVWTDVIQSSWMIAGRDHPLLMAPRDLYPISDIQESSG